MSMFDHLILREQQLDTRHDYKQKKNPLKGDDRDDFTKANIV